MTAATTSIDVLTIAENVLRETLRAAAARDWAQANDGNAACIDHLLSAARYLPGHGSNAIDSYLLKWNAGDDSWEPTPFVRDALGGDALLADTLLRTDAFRTTMADRVLAVLREEGASTLDAIAARLGENLGPVAVTLTQLANVGRTVQAGGWWSVAA